jgi:hypothetical protein
VEAQVIDLLDDLQREFGLSYGRNQVKDLALRGSSQID